MSSRWVPRIPSPFGGGQPPPPFLQDHQAPKYIVGNEPAGDTIIVCDFLDPGDGTGVAAAIAAALVNPGDIWCRPGTYNFGTVTSPAMPLTVPDSVLLRGADRNLTIFVGDDESTQDMFVLGDSSTLQEIQFVVPGDDGAAAGFNIIQLSGVLSAIRGCIIDMSTTPLSTQIAIGTGPGPNGANGCVVEDCDVHMPATANPDPNTPFIGILFGADSIASPYLNGGPIARDVRIYGGEFGILFLNVAGGTCEGISIIGNVTASTSAGIGWVMRLSAVSPVIGCRISGVFYTSDTGENPAFRQSCISLSSQVVGAPTVICSGFEVSDVMARFVRGANPASDRLCLDINASDGGGQSVLANITISNVNSTGHVTGARIRSGSNVATSTLGEVRNVSITNFNAITPLAAGGNTGRGVDLQVADVTVGVKIQRVSIVNCDFALTAATAIGVNVGAQVNNTIIVANQLTPSGGTAIVDGGTNTEIGHNITT